MPFTPKWVQILPLEKVQAALDLMRQLDISLFQRQASRQPLTVTLNRATYDAELIRAISDTYQTLGWNLAVTEQSGALIFAFIARQTQETS